MPNRTATPSQAAITRAVRAVIAAGCPVGRVEICTRSGRVVVFAATEGQAGRNPWDELLDDEA